MFQREIELHTFLLKFLENYAKAIKKPTNNTALKDGFVTEAIILSWYKDSEKAEKLFPKIISLARNLLDVEIQSQNGISLYKFKNIEKLNTREI